MTTPTVYTAVVPSITPGSLFKVKLPTGTEIEVRPPPNVRAGQEFKLMPYHVSIPSGVNPGQQFSAMVNDMHVPVVVPPGARTGQVLLIYAPSFPSATTPLTPAQEHQKIAEFAQQHMHNGPSPELRAKADTIDADRIPVEFLCPITQEIMLDPVFLMDGHTYEREAIKKWLESHNTSPKTNEPLPAKTLIPNQTMRSQTHEFVERYS